MKVQTKGGDKKQQILSRTRARAVTISCPHMKLAWFYTKCVCSRSWLVSGQGCRVSIPKLAYFHTKAGAFPHKVGAFPLEYVVNLFRCARVHHIGTHSVECLSRAVTVPRANRSHPRLLVSASPVRAAPEMEEPFQPEQKDSGNREPIHSCVKNKEIFLGWRKHLGQQAHERNGE